MKSSKRIALFYVLFFILAVVGQYIYLGYKPWLEWSLTSCIVLFVILGVVLIAAVIAIKNDAKKKIKTR